MTRIEVVPYLYQVKIPAGHSSATCMVEAINHSSSSCDNGYLNLNFTLPSGTNYTGTNYMVIPNEGTSIAYVYPPVPPTSRTIRGAPLIHDRLLSRAVEFEW